MTPPTDKPVPEPTEADRALAAIHDLVNDLHRKWVTDRDNDGTYTLELNPKQTRLFFDETTQWFIAHRTSAVAEAVAGLWRTGLPPVDEGRQRVFLCSVKDCETPMTLIYSNRYIADMSDGQHDPGEAIETSPDSGEYYWTGWFEEGCSQCDTFWRFDREVEAWMELPARAALHPATKKGK